MSFLKVDEKEIWVCSGAGCKAWDSERIANDLAASTERFGLGPVKVVRVPCLKNCGGGASVKWRHAKDPAKCREPKEALKVLGTVPVEAVCF